MTGAPTHACTHVEAFHVEVCWIIPLHGLVVLGHTIHRYRGFFVLFDVATYAACATCVCTPF